MEYEDRIVSFIDILAFKEMIKVTDSKDPDKEDEATSMLNKLQAVISTLQTEITEAISNRNLPQGTKASMFSDSVVVSIPKAESRGVLTLFKLLKKLQIRLLTQDILLRGSIVHGKLIHQDQLIIGPALINAYDVESKSALYPRIVIDPNVLRLYVRTQGIPVRQLRLIDKAEGKTIKQDFDGTSYIDYFNTIDDYCSESVIEYFQKLDKMIKKYLGRKYDTSIRMKYMWMNEKLKSSSYPDEIKYSYKSIRRTK